MKATTVIYTDYRLYSRPQSITLFEIWGMKVRNQRKIKEIFHTGETKKESNPGNAQREKLEFRHKNSKWSTIPELLLLDYGY